MKDSEFIELLNLYLDHEISATDAARLESEVQGNPARRRIYQEYCRMQKACKLLTADFQTEGQQVGADRNVIAFNPVVAAGVEARRRRNTAFYGVGAFAAAAACVALVFVSRQREESTPVAAPVPVVAAVAAPGGAPAKAPGVEAARGGIVSVASRAGASTLVENPLLLANSQGEAVFAAAINEANSQLAWIHQLQLAPVQTRNAAEELRFDATPASLRPEARVLGGHRAPAEATVEMTAFRFVK